MQEKYLIMNDPSLFQDNLYVLSYNLVICHAIFVYLKNSKQTSFSDIESILEDIYSRFEQLLACSRLVRRDQPEMARSLRVLQSPLGSEYFPLG